MDRYLVELDAPGLAHRGTVIRYGHWGRPVVVFPSEAGRAWDYENNGMVAAVQPLIDAGRIKLYCVDSFDRYTWSDSWLPLEERARRHGAYASWITEQVAGFIGADTPGAGDAIVTGCSLGAYHALQFALTRADLFPVAICLSGNYDPTTWRAWGDRGDAAYFANPTHYVPNLGGDHLDWLRSRFFGILVAGQGAWETHPTGALPSTRHMGHLLAEKGLNHELQLWGHDVSHDWHWW
ncbi:MAG: esterase, partial [Propionibacteriaceae bacterium]|nr:esterase [Propionibacteriaceae bacterium]